MQLLMAKTVRRRGAAAATPNRGERLGNTYQGPGAWVSEITAIPRMTRHSCFYIISERRVYGSYMAQLSALKLINLQEGMNLSMSPCILCKHMNVEWSDRNETTGMHVIGNLECGTAVLIMRCSNTYCASCIAFLSSVINDPSIQFRYSPDCEL